MIHPFGDANGRLMGMVCDLLLLREGLKPLPFAAIKGKSKEEFYLATEQAQRWRDLMPILDMLDLHRQTIATADTL